MQPVVAVYPIACRRCIWIGDGDLDHAVPRVVLDVHPGGLLCDPRHQGRVARRVVARRPLSREAGDLVGRVVAAVLVGGVANDRYSEPRE